MGHEGRRSRGLLMGACAALTLLASPAFGQSDPSLAAQTSTAAPSNPDFMLGRPRASVAVRGNWLVASAGSDIYDFVTEHLSIEKSDFNSALFATDVNVAVLPQLDIVGGFEAGKKEIPSEYRSFSETVSGSTRTLPIQQVTALQQMHFTGSVKFAVLPRGRQISRLAWIPRTFIPYVGGGGGITKYTFRQSGDFVDIATVNPATGVFWIFTDSFHSSGWAPSAHAFGGTDIQVFKRLYLSLEGRYTWVQAELDQDFIGFEPMDLGGFRFGAGISVVF